MFNIIRSLNYSARHDKVNILGVITLLIMPVFVLYLSSMLSPDTIGKLTPSVYIGSQQMGIVFVFMSFVTLVLTCRVVGGDASDKTINYEFLAGHSRSRIFAGRTISGLIWGVLIVFAFMMLPLGYLSLISGWGLETSPRDMLLRCFLVLFPLIRICALDMMFASVTRSAGKGIAIGFAATMVVAILGSVVQEFLGIDLSYHTGMTNAAYLLVPQNSWHEVIGGETVSVFDTSIKTDMILKTVIASLIFTAIYLTVSYINFVKKDRD